MAEQCRDVAFIFDNEDKGGIYLGLPVLRIVAIIASAEKADRAMMR